MIGWKFTISPKNAEPSLRKSALASSFVAVLDSLELVVLRSHSRGFWRYTFENLYMSQDPNDIVRAVEATYLRRIDQ